MAELEQSEKMEQPDGCPAGGAMAQEVSSLWRLPDYRRWYAGDILGDLGASVRRFAMPLVAVAVGGGATAAGLIGTLGQAAGTLALLPAGVLADRGDRRRRIIVGHLLRGALFAGAAAAWWCGWLSLAALAVVAVCSSVLSSVFGLASDAVIKRVVPPERLAEAAAANQARDGAVSLVSSPLAGLLMGVSPVAPFLAEAVGHLAGASCVWRIRSDLSAPTPGRGGAASSDDGGSVPGQEPGQEPAASRPGGARLGGRAGRVRTAVHDGVRDVAAGWGLFRREPNLLALVAAMALGSVSLSSVFLVLPVSWRLGGMTTARVGVLMTLEAVASLAGAVVAPALVRRVPGRYVVLGGGVIEVAALGVCAVVSDPLGQVLALAVASLLLGPTNAVTSGYAMRLIPEDRMGVTMSAVQLLNIGPVLVVPLAAGWGTDALGAPVALGGAAVVHGCSVLVLAASPCVRHLGVVAAPGR